MLYRFDEDPVLRQLITFLTLVVISAIALTGAGWLIALLVYGKQAVEAIDVFNPDSIAAAKLIQAFSHIGLFLLPALVFAALSGKPIAKYLNLGSIPKFQGFLMSGLLFMFSLPLIAFLLELNLSFSLPESLKSVENWMRQMEDNATVITEAIIRTDKFFPFLANIFILALLPALGEEFVFRGFFMRFFSKFIPNIHLNILVVAVLFSALHFQFFGFLPRLYLGIALGYLFFWSGSLWLPIFVHFLNNALTVTVFYLFETGIINTDPESMSNFEPSLQFGLEIAALMTIGFWFVKNQKNTQPFS